MTISPKKKPQREERESDAGTWDGESLQQLEILEAPDVDDYDDEASEELDRDLDEATEEEED